MLGHYPYPVAATKTLSLCSKVSRVRATSESKNDNTLEDQTSMKGKLGIRYNGPESLIGYENFWPAYSVKQSLPSLLQVDQTPFRMDEKDGEIMPQPSLISMPNLNNLKESA